jgi:aldehyde:ferredoxin oxidoreductase
MIGGFFGRILRVTLDSGTSRVLELEDGIARDFLGCRGLGTKLLFDELAPGTDPLSKENLLIFATGPMNGTNAPLSSRYAVVTRSPLTGTILSANSGGRFAMALKSTGFDAVVIEGKADTPVYLWIDGEAVEIRDASHLWGMTSPEVTATIQQETSPEASVACIGPAGETLVRFSSVMNEVNRAAGRGGAGAVMGSKNLKAIVVHGSERTPISDRERLDRAKKQSLTLVGETPVTKNLLREYGTAVLVDVINALGGFPTCNHRDGVFENSDSVSARTLKELHYTGSFACATCPVACGRKTRTRTREGEGPEFETIWALGPMCGSDDLEAICNANYNCNELGFDTMSAGNTIACAMELSEIGALDADTERRIRDDLGRDLRFGDSEAVLRLTELIGRREGIGDLLAEGSYRLAERFGRPDLSMSVKKLELPAYDPRAFAGMALAFATSSRGGCHLRSYLISPEALSNPVGVDRFSTRGKPALVKLYQDLSAAVDASGMCLFTLFALNPDVYADLLAGATGLDLDGKGLLRIGERIWTLERLFNVREGFTRADDRLPKRFSEVPLSRGHSKGVMVDLEPMLDEYYDLRGWTKEGEPKEETREELLGR